jgi:ribosomal protein L7/L12
MNFDAWAQKNLSDGGTSRDRIVWEAAALAATMRCVAACEAERLAEPGLTPEDEAYERGIDDCVSAIRIGSAETMASSGSAGQRIAALHAELQLLLDQESALAAESLHALKQNCLAAARAGRYNEAIKDYRSATGLSLLEAKYAVDALLSQSR